LTSWAGTSSAKGSEAPSGFYVYTYPSKKAVTAIKRKVRMLCRRASQPSLRILLLRVNAALRGWANYFKHGVSKRTFSYLDSFAWQAVTRWLRKRHVGLNWTVIRRRNMHGWQITVDGITLFRPSTVAVTRYRYRGTKIPTPWTTSTQAAA
jgi:RNA-directed DNA polymerase